MNKRQHSDDYYPLRWKIADGIEDMFLLHRNTIVGILAVLGLAIILIGFFTFDGDGTTNTDTSATPPPAVANDDQEDDETDQDVEVTTTTAAPETTTTTAAPETTTTTTQSPRTPADDAAIANTENGRLVRVSMDSVEIIGGVPTDAAADEALAITAEVFADLPIDDRQLVDAAFDDSPLNFRIDDPDLFEYNSDALKAEFLPVIDLIAESIIAQGWTVQVGGHTDSAGSSDGNQRLSEGRAASAARRLLDQGVDPASITTIGFGESQPIADNATEAGRLLNRRVEFLINP